MKSKGFLDDIEKAVDDFSTEEKKQINTHVDSKIDWYKMLEEQRYKESINKSRSDRFQRERLQDWSDGWSTTTSPKNKDTIRCKCGAYIEIFFIQENVDKRVYDWANYSRDMRIEVDQFFCPRCTAETRIVGKITDLKVKLME